MARSKLTKARYGSEKARELLERLADEEFRERCRVTEEDMVLLDRLCSGKYLRNSQAILAGIKFRAEYAYAKPVQKFEHSGAIVNITIGGKAKP